MATIITASELRAVLGVSSSLYSDAILTDQIDAAEGIILPMLVQWKANVVSHICKDEIETLYTDKPHDFYVGQIVDISGVGVHTLQNKTILEIPNSTSFTVSHEIADHILEKIIPAGLALPNSPTSYVGNSNVEAAVLAVAVEIFASRNAPGGQTEGVDFSPAPFRLGRSLFNRVSGLLGPFIDVESMIG
jgi:hypothetical protein